MEEVIDIFGHGKDLSILQMCCRGNLVFFITLILIRVSGRRSFGIRTPLDNIIVILSGAVLSRGVVGASPFWPVITTSFVIVLLHRLLGLLLLNSRVLSKLVEGEKILLFENDKFLKDKMQQAIVNEEDIMQGIRKSADTEKLQKIEKIYIEPSGEITAIKKEADL